MAATLIDGKSIAAERRMATRIAVEKFAGDTGHIPGLAVILVGDDPASRIYVGSKLRLTRECGMRSFDHSLPEATPEHVLTGLIKQLNADDAVDGILLQMPLPAHLDANAAIQTIDPAKDVDGLHPLNAGLLIAGNRRGFVPCTPQGCVHLARAARGKDLSGLDALVIGRSILVGIPVALLLQQANCTVTMAHSRSRDLAALCRNADLMIAAIGRPELIRGAWIKPGATIIDVGINRVASGDGSNGRGRIVGDVDLAEARESAGAITPVPGGVGPMTLACLLENTLQAAKCRRQPAA